MINKYAVVTGAGSGIGRDTSIALAQNGFQVMLVGRSRQKLEETAELVGKKNAVFSCPADITIPGEVQSIFNQIKSTFGRLDLLFNNAGINIKGKLEDITYDSWQAVINTNLSGSFLCIQEAFKIMKSQHPQGGRIINNGSISAYVPRPHSVPYTCSKHAITGLTKSTSLEGRKYNIACSQIDIGNVATPMAEKMKDGTLQADGSIRVEPIFSLKHVTDAIVYMADLPLEANVQFMTVMATKMPFIGRG